ncbi:MAG: undecaprenyl-diphosphate phosphatase [Ilumatobacteraceae bacterium]
MRKTLLRRTTPLAIVTLACLGFAGAAFAAGDGLATAERLSAWQAVILGIVEGVTEYLPVSSTGHLVLVERLMDLGRTEQARTAIDAYTVIIQFGAILAVLALSKDRVISVFKGLVGRDDDGRHLLFNLVVAFVPAAILGLTLADTIDAHLLEAGPVAGALIVGGVAILLLGSRLRSAHGRGQALEELTIRSALIIGLAQALALWPGTSRSLVTILGGLLVGLSMTAAVEFSFLLGLITLTAATGLSVLKDGSTVIDTYGWSAPLIGIVFAGISAFLAVRSFVAYLKQRDLDVFGWYRIALGIVIAVLIVATDLF